MNTTQLKAFFRQFVKVVPGGPASGPAGKTRGAGLLEMLDKLVDFAEGAGAAFLTGTYTATASGMQTITVPDAALFAAVGVEGLGGSLNPLAYGGDYTQTGNVLTVLAAANVQAGEVIHYSYLTGNVSEGSAGPALRPGTVIRFDVHEALYGPVIGGTFTVDVAGAQPGYTVRADLDPQSSEIVLPATGFNRAKNSPAFVIGAYNYYLFLVGPDGVIDYLISQRS